MSTDYICMGYLTKHAGLGKRNLRRFFVLHPNYLDYYVEDTSQEKIDSIPLQSIISIGRGDTHNTIKNTKTETTFRVITKKRVYILTAASADEAENWVTCLRARLLMREVSLQPGPISMSFKGSEVRGIVPNGEAEKSGIRAGWRVLSVNEETLHEDANRIIQAIKKTSDLNKPTLILFKIPIPGQKKLVYAIISHRWQKGYHVEKVPTDEDPNDFWAKWPSTYSSVMFKSSDGGKNWSLFKKKGVGAIDKILNQHVDILSKHQFDSQPMSITTTTTTTTKHVTNISKKDQISQFEAFGNACFARHDFPEAAFWFFQYEVYKKRKSDKKSRIGSNAAISNAGPEWEGFGKFLGLQHANGRIHANTTWNEVRDMWLSRRGSFSPGSRLSSVKKPRMFDQIDEDDQLVIKHLYSTGASHSVIAQKLNMKEKLVRNYLNFERQSQKWKVHNYPMKKGWKPSPGRHHDLTYEFTEKGKCSVTSIIARIRAGEDTPPEFFVKSTGKGMYFQIKVTRQAEFKQNQPVSFRSNDGTWCMAKIGHIDYEKQTYAIEYGDEGKEYRSSRTKMQKIISFANSKIQLRKEAIINPYDPLNAANRREGSRIFSNDFIVFLNKSGSPVNVCSEGTTPTKLRGGPKSVYVEDGQAVKLDEGMFSRFSIANTSLSFNPSFGNAYRYDGKQLIEYLDTKDLDVIRLLLEKDKTITEIAEKVKKSIDEVQQYINLERVQKRPSKSKPALRSKNKSFEYKSAPRSKKSSIDTKTRPKKRSFDSKFTRKTKKSDAPSPLLQFRSEDSGLINIGEVGTKEKQTSHRRSAWGRSHQLVSTAISTTATTTATATTIPTSTTVEIASLVNVTVHFRLESKGKSLTKEITMNMDDNLSSLLPKAKNIIKINELLDDMTELDTIDVGFTFPRSDNFLCNDRLIKEVNDKNAFELCLKIRKPYVHASPKTMKTLMSFQDHVEQKFQLRTKMITIYQGKIGISFKGNTIYQVDPRSQAGRAGCCVGWNILLVNDERMPNDDKVIANAIKKTHKANLPTKILFQEVKVNKEIIAMIHNLFKEGITSYREVKQSLETELGREIDSVEKNIVTWIKNDRSNLLRAQFKNGKKKHLNLSSNAYTHDDLITISDLLELNSTLTKLFLNGNDVDDSGMIAIASTLKVNSTLKELHLCKNKIGNSGIIELGKSLEVNSILEVLFLNNNQIDDGGIGILANILKVNSTIKEIHLAGNHVANLGCEAIATSLKSNISLSILNLEANNIECNGTKSIAEGLMQNTCLTDLRLAFNKISDMGAEELAKALKTNHSLKFLDLRGNEMITINGSKTIATSVLRSPTLLFLSGIPILNLKNNDSRITTLDLSCWKCANAEAIVIDLILKVNTMLTSLNLQNNTKIGVEAANTLALSILESKTITIFSGIPVLKLKANDEQTTVLDVRASKCSTIESVVLQELLKINSTLKKLILDENQFGDDSIKAIMDALRSNSTLKELHFHKNNIQSEECKWIGKALEFNQTLTYLHLQSNNIDCIGAQTIGEGLQHNSGLTNLQLRSNKISDLGTNYLAYGVQKHGHLKILNLEMNKIGDKGAEAICKLLLANTILQTIWLYGNLFSREAKQRLRIAKSNKSSSIINFGL